jgi:hypothetical protein
MAKKRYITESDVPSERKEGTLASEELRAYRSRPGKLIQRAPDVNLPVEKKSKSPGNGAGSRVVIDDVPAPKKKIRSGMSAAADYLREKHNSQEVDHKNARERNEKMRSEVSAGTMSQKDYRDTVNRKEKGHMTEHEHPVRLNKNVWHSPDAKDTNLPVEKKKKKGGTGIGSRVVR